MDSMETPKRCCADNPLHVVYTWPGSTVPGTAPALVECLKTPVECLKIGTLEGPLPACSRSEKTVFAIHYEPDLLYSPDKGHL